jgi:hypothetical protein
MKSNDMHDRVNFVLKTVKEHKHCLEQSDLSLNQRKHCLLKLTVT